jgi:hypothetical protein
MRLGFSGGESGKSEKKKNNVKPSVPSIPAEEDPVMKRLEKFKEKPRLKRHSEVIMERLAREKKR